MAKKQEPYWFHHDGNARRDEKIMDMMEDYGPEGYGWWWILLELMREATDYKLRLNSKYLARELYATPDRVCKFIDDCIDKYKLFQSDNEHFWSNSFVNRMANYDATCEKRRIAGARSHIHD